MNLIHIAAAVDDNYVQHLGVMLCSLFENNNHKFHIHLLKTRISQRNLEALHTIIDTYKQAITVIDTQFENGQQFFISGHITLESYLKIFLPKYIASETDKVLYLDADIIVNQNIEPLWSSDINTHLLGAVEDVTLDRQKALKNPANYKYFNAGVLLINLKKWREHNIMEKALVFIENHHELILYHDQDALNAVLYDQWLSLHPKYNMQAPLYMEEFETYYGNPKELEEAKKDPVIIHYSAPLKPWHYLSYHPYTSEYYKYLSLTPWKDFKPADKNWVRVVRKLSRPWLRKLGIKKVFGKHLY